MRYFSFGDICNSRCWISFQFRPWASWRWWLSFKPTYQGTIRGLHIGLPFMTIIGHVRDLSFDHSQKQEIDR